MSVSDVKTCEGCGREFNRNPKWSRESFARRKTCGRQCVGMIRPDVREHYEVTGLGCWVWLGKADANGYGKAYDASRPTGKRLDWAHRISYRVHRGEIPEGHDLDHLCENTLCINPDHLDPVTKIEHAYRTFRRAGYHDLQVVAARMRRQGLTYTQIAEVLGLAGRGSAAGRVKSAIANGLVRADGIPAAQHLSESEKDDIALLCAFGIPQTEVAAFYGTDSSNVSRISAEKNGKKRKR